MKKVFIALAIILLAVVATPFVFGVLAKNSLDDMLVNINSLPGYKAEIVEYQRGLVSSQAKLKLSFDFYEDPNSDLPDDMQDFAKLYSEGVVFDIDLSHGPVTAKPSPALGFGRVLVNLDANQAFVAEAIKSLNIPYLWQTELQLGFGGKSKLISSVPAFEFQPSGEKGSVKFGGMMANGDLSNYGSAYDVVMQIAETVIGSATSDGMVTIAPISITAKGEVPAQMMLAVGDMSMKIPSIKSEGSLEGQLSNFQFDVFVSSPTDEVLNVEYKFGLDRIESKTMEKTLTDARFHLAFENLSKQFVVDYTAMMDRIIKAANPAGFDEAMQKELQVLLTTFLETSPKLAFRKVAFTLGTDTYMDLSADITVDKDAAANADLSQPFALIPAIAANLDADFSRNLANEIMGTVSKFNEGPTQEPDEYALSEEDQKRLQEQQEMMVGMMIDNYVQTGFLKETDKGLKIVAHFSSSQLEVNGNPIPLPF